MSTLPELRPRCFSLNIQESICALQYAEGFGELLSGGGTRGARRRPRAVHTRIGGGSRKRGENGALFQSRYKFGYLEIARAEALRAGIVWA